MLKLNLSEQAYKKLFLNKRMFERVKKVKGVKKQKN